jgi:hypothetical protein
MALGKQYVAGREIESLQTDIAALAFAPLNCDEIAVLAGEFLDHYSIRPAWHHAASKYPGGLAWPDTAVERPPGRNFSFQPRRFK